MPIFNFYPSDSNSLQFSVPPVLAIGNMTRKFLEIFTLAAVNDVARTSSGFPLRVETELREILNILMNGPGVRAMEFREDAADPNTLLCVAGWESLADHDYLDVQGTVPKLLKRLGKLFTTENVHYMYIDVAKVGLEDKLLSVDIFKVVEGKKAEFQKEINARTGLVGAWHTVIPVPPLPNVMPTDMMELAIIEHQKLRAEQNLKNFTPAIWIAFSTPTTEALMGEFRAAVARSIESVKTATYRQYLSGKQE